MNPLTALSLPQLRERRSAKWRTYDPDVLPLWVAEMDTPLAPPVAEALTAAVARGDIGYVWPGAFAEAYAEFAAARLGWHPDPARSMLIPDVMRGIAEVLRVVTARGDGVVINPPVYPPFFSYLRDAERRAVEVPLAEAGAGAYRLDLAGLEAAFASAAVRAYLLCNPHNPTGTVFGRNELLAVAQLAQRYGVRLLSDEIHAPLAYPGPTPVSLLSLAGEAEAAARGFVFGSASKGWNVPGLKAALVFAGPAAVADLRALSPEISLSTGLLGVIAGEVAFRQCGGWLDALLAGLDANRRLLAELVAGHLPGVVYRPPDATYLAWLDWRATGLGEDPSVELLDRARVAVTPGPAFGAAGRGFVRLNFATPPEILRESVRRMGRVLG